MVHCDKVAWKTHSRTAAATTPAALTETRGASTPSTAIRFTTPWTGLVPTRASGGSGGGVGMTVTPSTAMQCVGPLWKISDVDEVVALAVNEKRFHLDQPSPAVPSVVKFCSCISDGERS